MRKLKRRARAGKEIKGETNMTDFQLKKILSMVLEIMKSSKDLDEAVKKVEGLSKDEK